MCQEHVQTLKSKEIEKKETANMKHIELVEANKKVVNVICNKLCQETVISDNSDNSAEHIKFFTLKIFSRLTNPQFKAFFLAHNTNITTKSQLPANGYLKDAEKNTVRNRIRVVFDCRLM
jgi:hypothetical protein